jgi:hypothetical protein
MPTFVPSDSSGSKREDGTINQDYMVRRQGDFSKIKISGGNHGHHHFAVD